MAGAADRGSARCCGPGWPTLNQASPEDYRRLDTLFHLSIAELTGSSLLAAACADARMRLNDLLNAIPVLQRNIDHTAAQHTAIVDGHPGRRHRRARSAPSPSTWTAPPPCCAASWSRKVSRRPAVPWSVTAELTKPARRTVARVETKRRLGPDAQVDDKAMIIGPDAPRRTDPFLVLSEDWFSSPGFEWHPHRGVETVTTVLDGVLEHGDNAGHAGALEPGDVQWMTAGRGIIHRELAYRNEHAHTLQLWVNMPASAKLASTRYQDIRAAARPVSTAGGVRIDVISAPRQPAVAWLGRPSTTGRSAARC